MWTEQERRLVADMQREIRGLRGRIEELESKEATSKLWLAAQAAHPADPAINHSILYQCKPPLGDGDILLIITNSAGATKTATIADHSEL